MKRFKQLKQIDRAGRLALRFFAGMIILTLIARGTAGAAMARVQLQRISSGTIVQKAHASASLIAEDGEAFMLPSGITVEKLWVSAGQTVQAGSRLLQLSCSEFQDALDAAAIQLAQQKAQLAQLNNSSPVDTSGVSSAQQTLAQANEDFSREQQRAEEAVDRAACQQQSAQQAYDEALIYRDLLYSQTEPLPSEEQLQEADSAVESAKSSLSAANEALSAAHNSQEDIQLASKRRIESAQQALDQANTQFSQAKKLDALERQTKQADAAAVKQNIAKSEKRIELLEHSLNSEGIFTAPHDAQIIRCDLIPGQLCPERSPLLLSKEGSILLVQFFLPAEQAEKVTAGQKVVVRQDQQTASAAIQTISQPNAENQCILTAAAAETDTSRLKADLPAEIEITFSRTDYSCCVPISAIRQDSEGSFVLAVEQQKTAFGITSTAVRIPVTVLEIDSDGLFAAVDGALPDSIIVEADRALKPDNVVRIET